MKNAQLLSVLCLTTLMTTSVLCSQNDQTVTADEAFPSTAVTQPNSDIVMLKNDSTLADATSLEQAPTTPAPVTTEAPSIVNQATTSIQEEVTKAGCFATAVVSLKEQGNKLATYVGTSRIAQFVQAHPKTSSALVATVVVAGIAWYYKDAIKNWVNKKQANKA